MAKVTIIIEDQANGGIKTQIDNAKQVIEGGTPAQNLAFLAMLQLNETLQKNGVELYAVRGFNQPFKNRNK